MPKSKIYLTFRRPFGFRMKVPALLVSACLLFSDAAAYGTPAVPASPSFELSRLEIPETLGKIEEFRQGTQGTGKTVIYIQDAHDSLEAQENIAALIGRLTETHAIKTVFEEGYEGEVPADRYFEDIRDPEVRERVSYYLMDKLRIGGAEYAYVNRKTDFVLMGSDDFELHRQNIEWYRRAAAGKDAALRDIGILEKELTNLEEKYFSNEAKGWIKLSRRQKDGQISFTDYLSRSRDFAPEAFDKKDEAFAARYPVLSLLERAARGEETPGLKNIDPHKWFEESSRLEAEIAAKLLLDARDLQIFRYQNGLELLKRLNALEVSASDYEIVRNDLLRFQTAELLKFIVKHRDKSLAVSAMWEKNVQNALNFYETARRRDRVIEERLRGFIQNGKEQAAVLVYGGFHRGAITSIFKKLGLSYAVISPAISEIRPEHQERYRSLMAAGYERDFHAPRTVSTAARAPSDFAVARFNPRSEPALEHDIRRFAAAVKSAKRNPRIKEVSVWDIDQNLADGKAEILADKGRISPSFSAGGGPRSEMRSGSKEESFQTSYIQTIWDYVSEDLLSHDPMLAEKREGKLAMLYQNVLKTLRSLDQKIQSGKLRPGLPLRVLGREESGPGLPDSGAEIRIGVLPFTGNPLGWAHIVSMLMLMDELNLNGVLFLVQGEMDYKPLAQKDRIPAKFRHGMTREVLKNFAPLLYYTDAGLGNNDIGEKNIHTLFDMNPGKRVRLFYVSGTETEARVKGVMEHLLEYARKENFGKNPKHFLELVMIPIDDYDAGKAAQRNLDKLLLEAARRQNTWFSALLKSAGPFAGLLMDFAQVLSWFVPALRKYVTRVHIAVRNFQPVLHSSEYRKGLRWTVPGIINHYAKEKGYYGYPPQIPDGRGGWITLSQEDFIRHKLRPIAAEYAQELHQKYGDRGAVISLDGDSASGKGLFSELLKEELEKLERYAVVVPLDVRLKDRRQRHAVQKLVVGEPLSEDEEALVPEELKRAIQRQKESLGEKYLFTDESSFFDHDKIRDEILRPLFGFYEQGAEEMRLALSHTYDQETKEVRPEGLEWRIHKRGFVIVEGKYANRPELQPFYHERARILDDEESVSVRFQLRTLKLSPGDADRQHLFFKAALAPSFAAYAAETTEDIDTLIDIQSEDAARWKLIDAGLLRKLAAGRSAGTTAGGNGPALRSELREYEREEQAAMLSERQRRTFEMIGRELRPDEAGNPPVLLVEGLPGTGKSTWAEQLKAYRESQGLKTVLVSNDKLLKVQSAFSYPVLRLFIKAFGGEPSGELIELGLQILFDADRKEKLLEQILQVKRGSGTIEVPGTEDRIEADPDTLIIIEGTGSWRFWRDIPNRKTVFLEVDLDRTRRQFIERSIREGNSAMIAFLRSRIETPWFLTAFYREYQKEFEYLLNLDDRSRPRLERNDAVIPAGHEQAAAARSELRSKQDENWKLRPVELTHEIWSSGLTPEQIAQMYAHSKGLFTLYDLLKQVHEGAAEVRGGYLLGYEDKKGVYLAAAQEMRLGTWNAAYKDYNLNPDRPESSILIDALAYTKKPIVFFVPRNVWTYRKPSLISGSTMPAEVSNELEALLTMPGRMKNVYFVFGAYQTVPDEAPSSFLNRYDRDQNIVDQVKYRLRAHVLFGEPLDGQASAPRSELRSKYRLRDLSPEEPEREKREPEEPESEAAPGFLRRHPFLILFTAASLAIGGYIYRSLSGEPPANPSDVTAAVTERYAAATIRGVPVRDSSPDNLSMQPEFINAAAEALDAAGRFRLSQIAALTLGRSREPDANPEDIVFTVETQPEAVPDPAFVPVEIERTNDGKPAPPSLEEMRRSISGGRITVMRQINFIETFSPFFYAAAFAIFSWLVFKIWPKETKRKTRTQARKNKEAEIDAKLRDARRRIEERRREEGGDIRSELRSSREERIKRIARAIGQPEFDEVDRGRLSGRIYRLNRLLAENPAIEDVLSLYTAFVPYESSDDVSIGSLRQSVKGDSPEVETDLERFFDRLYKRRNLHDTVVKSIFLGMFHTSEKVRFSAVRTLISLPAQQRAPGMEVLKNLAVNPETAALIVFGLISVLEEDGDIMLLTRIFKGRPEKPIARSALKAVSHLLENEKQGEALQALLDYIFDLERRNELLPVVLTELARKAPLEVAGPVLGALIMHEDEWVGDHAEGAFFILGNRLDEFAARERAERQSQSESRPSLNVTKENAAKLKGLLEDLHPFRILPGTAFHETILAGHLKAGFANEFGGSVMIAEIAAKGEISERAAEVLSRLPGRFAHTFELVIRIFDEMLAHETGPFHLSDGLLADIERAVKGGGTSGLVGELRSYTGFESAEMKKLLEDYPELRAMEADVQERRRLAMEELQQLLAGQRDWIREMRDKFAAKQGPVLKLLNVIAPGPARTAGQELDRGRSELRGTDEERPLFITKENVKRLRQLFEGLHPDNILPGTAFKKTILAGEMKAGYDNELGGTVMLLDMAAKEPLDFEFDDLRQIPERLAISFDLVLRILDEMLAHRAGPFELSRQLSDDLDSAGKIDGISGLPGELRSYAGYEPEEMKELLELHPELRRFSAATEKSRRLARTELERLLTGHRNWIQGIRDKFAQAREPILNLLNEMIPQDFPENRSELRGLNLTSENIKVLKSALTKLRPENMSADEEFRRSAFARYLRGGVNNDLSIVTTAEAIAWMGDTNGEGKVDFLAAAGNLKASLNLTLRILDEMLEYKGSGPFRFSSRLLEDLENYVREEGISRMAGELGLYAGFVPQIRKTFLEESPDTEKMKHARVRRKERAELKKILGGRREWLQLVRTETAGAQAKILEILAGITGESPESAGRSELRTAEPSDEELFTAEEIERIRDRVQRLELLYGVLSPSARKTLLTPGFLAALIGAKPAYTQFEGEPSAAPFAEELRWFPDMWDVLGMDFTTERAVSLPDVFNVILEHEDVLEALGLIHEGNLEFVELGTKYWHENNWVGFRESSTQLLDSIDNAAYADPMLTLVWDGLLTGYAWEDIETALQYYETKDTGPVRQLKSVFKGIGVITSTSPLKSRQAVRYIRRLEEALFYAYSHIKSAPGFERLAREVGLPEEVFEREISGIFDLAPGVTGTPTQEVPETMTEDETEVRKVMRDRNFPITRRLETLQELLARYPDSPERAFMENISGGIFRTMAMRADWTSQQMMVFHGIEDYTETEASLGRFFRSTVLAEFGLPGEIKIKQRHFRPLAPSDLPGVPGGNGVIEKDRNHYHLSQNSYLVRINEEDYRIGEGWYLEFKYPDGASDYLYDHHNLMYAFSHLLAGKVKERRYVNYDAHSDANAVDTPVPEGVSDPFTAAQYYYISNFHRGMLKDTFRKEDGWRYTWVTHQWSEPRPEDAQLYDSIVDRTRPAEIPQGGVASIDLDLFSRGLGEGLSIADTLALYAREKERYTGELAGFEARAFFISDLSFINPAAALAIFADLYPAVAAEKLKNTPDRSELRADAHKSDSRTTKDKPGSGEIFPLDENTPARLRSLGIKEIRLHGSDASADLETFENRLHGMLLSLASDPYRKRFEVRITGPGAALIAEVKDTGPESAPDEFKLQRELWTEILQGLMKGLKGIDGETVYAAAEPSFTEFFRSLEPDSRVIDIATGHGFVPSVAAEVSDRFDLHAMDIGVPGHRLREDRVAYYQFPAEHLGSERQPGSFPREADAATSLFGWEYSKDRAAALAGLHKILAPGAKIRFIIHHEDSIITRGNKKAAIEGRLLVQSGLIDDMLRYLKTLSDEDLNTVHRKLNELAGSVPEKFREAGLQPNGTGKTVIIPLVDIFEQAARLRTRSLAEAEDYFEQKAGAALSPLIFAEYFKKTEPYFGEDGAELLKMFEAAGFNVDTLEKFYDVRGMLLGWRLDAHKLPASGPRRSELRSENEAYKLISSQKGTNLEFAPWVLGIFKAMLEKEEKAEKSWEGAFRVPQDLELLSFTGLSSREIEALFEDLWKRGMLSRYCNMFGCEYSLGDLARRMLAEAGRQETKAGDANVPVPVPLPGDLDPRSFEILHEASDFESLVRSWFGKDRKLAAIDLMAGSGSFEKEMVKRYPGVFRRFLSVDRSSYSGSHVILDSTYQFAARPENQGRFDVVFLMAPAPHDMSGDMFAHLAAAMLLLKPDGMILLRLNTDDEHESRLYTLKIESLRGYHRITKESFPGLPGTAYTYSSSPIHVIARAAREYTPDHVLRDRTQTALKKIQRPLTPEEYQQVVFPLLEPDMLPEWHLNRFAGKLADMEDAYAKRKEETIRNSGRSFLKKDAPGAFFTDRIYKGGGFGSVPINPFIFEAVLELEYFRHNIRYGKYNGEITDGARSELRGLTKGIPVSGAPAAAVTRIEEMKIPAAVFMDAWELVNLPAKTLDGRMDELLALVSRHDDIDIYIHGDRYPLSSVKSVKFQKLITEYRARVHTSFLSRPRLNQKKLFLQVSLMENRGDAAFTGKLLGSLKESYGVPGEIIPLEYLQAGVLNAFLGLAESKMSAGLLIPAELLKEIGEAYAVLGPNGRWKLAESFAASIWAKIQASYVIQWSA